MLTCSYDFFCQLDRKLFRLAYYLIRLKLSWYGHILLKDEGDWVRRCIGLQQEIEEADVLWMIVLAHRVNLEKGLLNGFVVVAI